MRAAEEFPSSLFLLDHIQHETVDRERKSFRLKYENVKQNF